MDYSYFSNTVRKSTIKRLFRHKFMYREKYYMKLLPVFRKKNVIIVYFENMLDKSYFVLEYNYILHFPYNIYH